MNKMLLKILGSGSNQVSNKRTAASNYLKIGNKKILVDCGCGTLLRLDKAGIPLNDIDMIFISHFHMDHIADLYSLIWALKWPNSGRKKDLVIYGPVGFKKFYNTYMKPILFAEKCDLFDIQIKEITDKEVFDNFSVEIYSTKHTDESVAYKFTEDDKTLVIAGDTGFDSELIDFTKNADVLLIECSFDNSLKMNIHLTPQECGETAKKADVKKLILTHFYPTSSVEIRLKETKEVFENTILAEDLMDVEI